MTKPPTVRVLVIMKAGSRHWHKAVAVSFDLTLPTPVLRITTPAYSVVEYDMAAVKTVATDWETWKL